MKSLASIVFSFAMLIGCISSVAYAYDSYTTLEYTVPSSYTIEIPLYIDLNETDAALILAHDVELPEGQELVVKIDTSLSQINDNVLQLTTADSSSKTMGCYICATDETESGTGAPTAVFETDYTVAVFENGSETPIQYGGMLFTPLKDGVKRGQYTASLYYSITVMDYL